MAFILSKKLTKSCSLFGKRCFSGVPQQTTHSCKRSWSSRELIVSTVFSFSAGAGLSYAYAAFGPLQPQTIINETTKNQMPKQLQHLDSKHGAYVAAALSYANVKIDDQLEMREVDHVSDDDKMKIREQALIQNQQKNMDPINSRHGKEHDKPHFERIYGEAAVDISLKCCVSMHSVDDSNSGQSAAISSLCCQIYKNIRAREMLIDIKDKNSRRGQWLCVRVLPKDIKTEKSDNGDDIQVIKVVEICYYSSEESAQQDNDYRSMDFYEKHYCSCLGFEKIIVTGRY